MNNILQFLNADNIVQFSVVVAPVASAITEIIKRNFVLPKKYLPFINMGIGILAGLLYPSHFDLFARVVGGALAGLAGVGGYEAFFNRRPGLTEPAKKAEVKK